MRECLAARDDRDFLVASPRPLARPRARRAPTLAGRAALVLAFATAPLRRRAGMIVGSAVAAGAGVAICLNALSFQTGRHPAPIFSDPPRPVARAPRAAEPPKTIAPLARPEPAAAASTQAVPGQAAPPAPPRRPSEAAKPARDAIGEMIRATDPAAPAARADRGIAFAQRALTKLGYGPLKADGVTGTGTRAALERFEREQKLPVTGEATGRTLRELAQRSGLATE